VFLFAIIFSFLIKKPEEEEESDEEAEPANLHDDEEYLHQQDDGELSGTHVSVLGKIQDFFPQDT